MVCTLADGYIEATRARDVTVDTYVISETRCLGLSVCLSVCQAALGMIKVVIFDKYFTLYKKYQETTSDHISQTSAENIAAKLIRINST